MKEHAEVLIRLIKDNGLPMTAIAIILGWMYYLDWVDRNIEYQEKQELRVTIKEMSNEVRELNGALLECHAKHLQEVKEIAKETKKAIQELKK